MVFVELRKTRPFRSSHVHFQLLYSHFSRHTHTMGWFCSHYALLNRKAGRSAVTGEGAWHVHHGTGVACTVCLRLGKWRSRAQQERRRMSTQQTRQTQEHRKRALTCDGRCPHPPLPPTPASSLRLPYLKFVTPSSYAIAHRGICFTVSRLPRAVCAELGVASKQ